MIVNDLILKAANGEFTARTPVWLMRQAGRILPEYRELRDKFKDFKAYIKTPEAAAEATLQPVRILEVDAAIIFSDILVIPEAMGLDYEMIEKKGPLFPKTIQTKADIDALIIPNPTESLKYVTDAIRIVKKELHDSVPLIGFAGAPWTIFAYMVEGSGSKTFSKAKKMLYNEPELSLQLLEKITQSTILYLKAQISAGADMIQIFDSWAGILTPLQYETFALSYIRKICLAITEVPVTVFAKDAYFALDSMANLSCNTIGLDWCTNIAQAKTKLKGKTLQGNLDPCALYADKATIKQLTEKMLSDFGSQHYIANLGHGLYPDIEVDKVKFFIETVKNYKHVG
jgi:uroporphyrinogen decarboxylase